MMTSLVSRGVAVGAVVLATAASAASGCGGSSGAGSGTILVCGPGTAADGGECFSVVVGFDASAACGPGTVFSGGVCVAMQPDATTTCGPGTTRNASGQCVPTANPEAGLSCGAGTVDDGGVCVPIAAEGGTSCGAGTVDDGGVCVPVAGATDGGDTCGAGTHACAGACYADDDSAHCGATCASCMGSTPACVNGACACTPSSCGTGEACVNGACVATQCTNSNECDGGLCCNGACVAGATCCVQTDCPAIDACQSGVTCTAGQCTYTNVQDGATCNTTGTCCGGNCTSLQSDKFNCGACGASCYGGSIAASCLSGHCAELVAQADNSGSAAGGTRLYSPLLAIDATNVYFISPADGTILQSTIATLGNLSPKVIATENLTGTLRTISALVVDQTTVYWGSDPAAAVRSVPIGGGTVTSFTTGAGFSYLASGDPLSLAVDSNNLYVANAIVLGMAPKNASAPINLFGTTGNEYVYGTVAPTAPSSTGASVARTGGCSIQEYVLATSTLGMLATGEATITSLALSSTGVFWGAGGRRTRCVRRRRTAAPRPRPFLAPQTWRTARLRSAWTPATGTLYFIEGGGAQIGGGNAATPGPAGEALRDHHRHDHVAAGLGHTRVRRQQRVLHDVRQLGLRQCGPGVAVAQVIRR